MEARSLAALADAQLSLPGSSAVPAVTQIGSIGGVPGAADAAGALAGTRTSVECAALVDGTAVLGAKAVR